MKRFYIAAALLVVITAFAVVFNIGLLNKIDELSSAEQELFAALDSGQINDKDIDKLKTKWEEDSFLFSVAFYHCEFSDVEEKIFSLSTLISSGLKDDAKIVCIEIEQQLKSIRNSCRLSLSNLL